MIGETCPPSISPSSYKQAPVEEIFERGDAILKQHIAVVYLFWETCYFFILLYNTTIFGREFFTRFGQNLYTGKHTKYYAKKVCMCALFRYLYRSRARIVVSEDKFSRNRYISIVGNGYLTGRKKNYISPRLIQPIPLANNDTLMAC